MIKLLNVIASKPAMAHQKNEHWKISILVSSYWHLWFATTVGADVLIRFEKLPAEEQQGRDAFSAISQGEADTTHWKADVL